MHASYKSLQKKKHFCCFQTFVMYLQNKVKLYVFFQCLHRKSCVPVLSHYELQGKKGQNWKNENKKGDVINVRS